MGIWKKAEDALRANINDLLDQATDPVKELKLMIEDMDDFRMKQFAKVREAIKESKILGADLDEANDSLGRWTKRAKQETEKGNDANAKIALTSQITQEKAVARLKTAVEDSKKGIEKLETELRQLDDRIEYLKSQQDIVKTRVKIAKAEISIHGKISSHGNAPKADEILDRVDDKVKEMEAGAKADEEVAELARPKTAEERFSESELDDEVEKRLAALKAEKVKNK